MTRKFLPLLLLCFLFTTAFQSGDGDGDTTLYLPVVINQQVQATLKWAYGGCYSSWCETGWYSSPAAADINGDGRSEVIASVYSLFALDGETGALRWRSGGTANRTWPGVVVADLDRNGVQEIIIAQSGGLVSAYRLDGSLIWQKQPAGNNGELRGLLVADLDGNNSSLEVVVTRAFGTNLNTWVLDAAGNNRSGWPQPTSDAVGYSWGVYNANLAAGNMSGDARLELVVPSDVHYINAYLPDGSPLPANPSDYPGKTWGRVGVWEDLGIEKRGWGDCGSGIRTESYRVNFADGPAVITDVNNDGQREVVVTGDMYQCVSGYPSKYVAALIFNADRSRFVSGSFDWRRNPVDTGAPLTRDYNVIESVAPNPVVVDLDGDAIKEILHASWDGRMHAFWLDKTEHGSWPYSVYQASEGFYRLASEPVVVDLFNDGTAEVIFTSWTQKGSNRTGRLHILSAYGQPVLTIDLPNPRGSWNWNGSLPAPTLANIDGDADYELILNTAHSGVVVYDLPGTANARILWGTGRGNQQRTGSQ